MNKFLDELSGLCRDHLLEQKCLLVPNLRTGHQWLESVARSGRPVINLQIKTLRGLAMDLAGPELLRNGLTPLSKLAAVFLMERVWARCHGGLEGYLASVHPGTRFFRRLHQSLLQIRMTGKPSTEIDPGRFEVDSKGREIKTLLEAYVEELEKNRLVDEAGVYQVALEQMEKNPSTHEELDLVVYPEDMEWKGLEKKLIEAIPLDQRKVLPVDASGNTPSMAFFRAVGEVNEVREVIRRCLAQGLPFDEVEILVTDPAVYIPLFHELFERLKPDTQETETEPPPPLPKITFADGIPARYSRPSRALSAWLEWTRQDQYFQPILVSMIREGLLNLTGEQVSFTRLADALQSLPIGHGRDRYLKEIDHKLASLAKHQRNPLTEDEEAETPSKDGELGSWMKDTMEVLKELVTRLLNTCPPSNASPGSVLESARSFLNTCARTAGELDAYALNEFTKEIDQVIELMKLAEDGTVFDAREWLESSRDLSLLGSSPRPGHVHVSSLTSGGHSGRPHTFILGMDEGRFPGGGTQDPLLLDEERTRLSRDLSTAAERLQRRVEGFHRLLSRLRGKVTLSYPCRDIIQDRDQFPSPVLLTLVNPQGNGDGLTDIEAVSFAPSKSDGCLLETEWWLHQLASGPVNNDATEMAGVRFPHLLRGIQAVKARMGERVTEFDGLLGPQPEIDPCGPSGPVLSANGLQMIGRCPLAYFFRYVLHIEPPEETSLDPDVWLDPLAAGNLLHEVFREFMAGFIGTERRPSVQSDWEDLRGILDKQVTRAKELIPPLNEAAYIRQQREFETIARIFLTEEEKYAEEGSPIYLEASLGMTSQDTTTDLDTTKPISIKLPNGNCFHARGRIDRIDRTSQGKILIWDYKTGSDFIYTEKDMPYKQGRLIQHVLYLELVQSVLKEEVDRFGFFFPGRRARGNRITWQPEDFCDGRNVIQMLCQIAANGAFLATDKENDCRNCDYRRICSPIEESNFRSQVKLVNPENQELEPIRRLRKIEND